jgi:hypothetical protein
MLRKSAQGKSAKRYTKLPQDMTEDIEKHNQTASPAVHRTIQISFIVLGLSLFAFFFFRGRKENNDKVERIEKNKSSGTATVTRTGYLKGSYILAEFYYKGQPYTIKDFPPSDHNLRNLSFPVYFDSLNPTTAILDFTKPFFLPNLMTATTTCQTLKINEHDVMFVYEVNGKKYEQFQKTNSNSAFAIGPSYTIKYLISDPEVSHILQ